MMDLDDEDEAGGRRRRNEITEKIKSMSLKLVVRGDKVWILEENGWEGA
jgi:hypothetical protein